MSERRGRDRPAHEPERRAQEEQPFHSSGPLLEREDLATVHAEDARGLIRIYSELIEFKEELLRRALEVMNRLSPEARDEVTSRDVPGLRAQLAQYRERLEFWFGRLWELEGVDIDGERRQVNYRDRSVDLTRREYQLLVCLHRHPNQFLSADLLVQLAWGEPLSDEQLRLYVTRLRRKLRALGLPAQLINRPRKGYSLIVS